MDGRNESVDLQRVLERTGAVAVAVSGGIDSMTLAAVAHHVYGADMIAVHAVSPAVPPRSTALVKRYAKRLDWPLQIVDAAEFEDPKYLANPVNRCFYCKANLYAKIASLTELQIVSGTNTDDLADFRPGLKAATAYGVCHPYVEAGISKKSIRKVAKLFGLEDIANIPASPCLSSRLQTGIAVTPTRLRMIDRIEEFITEAMMPNAVRCRVLPTNLEIQLDNQSLARIDSSNNLKSRILEFATTQQELPIIFSAYRTGSSVIHPND